MLRLYLRLFFNKLEKFIHLLKNYKNLHYNFIKPALYRKKMHKVLENNKDKLTRKLEIIELDNQHKTSKSINFVR